MITLYPQPDKISQHYLIRYHKLIAYLRDKSEGSERHHVIPKCLGGGNDASNLVLCTPREHFICHWILSKVYALDCPERRKLLHAFGFMSDCSYKNERRLTSRQAERALIAKRAANTGEGNPMYGKIRSEETRQKVKDTLANTNKKPEVRERRRKATQGKNNGMYGKKHSEKTRRLASINNRLSYSAKIVAGKPGVNGKVYNKEETEYHRQRLYTYIKTGEI